MSTTSTDTVSSKNATDTKRDPSVDAARAAARSWKKFPFRERLRILKRFRAMLVERQEDFLTALEELPFRTDRTESLGAEVLPVAVACQFLEKESSKILKPKRHGIWKRPTWLWGLRSQVRHEPHGVVLVIAPSNYPFMLAGVQTLQAIIAGNSVLLKPGRHGAAALQLMTECLVACGLPPDVVTLLDPDPQSAISAIDAGVDFAVLTGSANTGTAVARQLSKTLTPSAMELSGSSAIFIHPSADLDLVLKALTFGLLINGSHTCIAPRRVFVTPSHQQELENRLRDSLSDSRPVPIAEMVVKQLQTVMPSALASGAELLIGDIPEANEMLPTVLINMPADADVLKEDIFAPLLSIVPVSSMQQALKIDRSCPYALGAVVFGDPELVTDLIDDVDAGEVVVNDIIAPTADPRIPFGGRNRSGFGVTRGAEGLLQMTRVKTVLDRRTRFLPHLDRDPATEHDQLTALMTMSHASRFGKRMRGVLKLLTVSYQRWRNQRSDQSEESTTSDSP